LGDPHKWAKMDSEEANVYLMICTQSHFKSDTHLKIQDHFTKPKAFRCLSTLDMNGSQTFRVYASLRTT